MGNILKKVDSRGALTVYTVVGKVTADEVSRAIQNFYDGNITLNVLWDLLKSDLSGLSSSDIHSVVLSPRKCADLRTAGKTAIVASADITYGISQMYALETEMQNLPFETRTFRTREKAFEWLSEKNKL